MRSSRTAVLVLLIPGLSAACGPELTDPASSNISGSWVSADTALGVTDFRLELAQAADGEVTGSWSARGVLVNGVCPPTLGCTPNNTVSGSNTVFQVFLNLLGAGGFTGQVESDGRFRGDLDGDRITFSRAVTIAGAAQIPRGLP